MTSRSRINASTVNKLDGANYPTWSFQIKMLLSSADLWTTVSGDKTEPASNAEAWNKDDMDAQALIALTVDEKIINQICRCTKSKEMFDKLKKMYADESSLNKQQVLTKFLNYKMKKDQVPTDAYNEIEILARSLTDMGTTIDEETTVLRIVSSLPKTYLMFKKAWDSVSTKEQTMVNLLSRLRKEELTAEIEDSDDDDDARPSAFKAIKNRQQNWKKDSEEIKELKRNSSCHNCGKPGHWARECRNKKATALKAADEDFSPRAAFGTIPSEFTQKWFSKKWFSDSGATRHVCGNKKWFRNFQKISPPARIYLANGGSALATGTGEIFINALIGGNWIPAKLEKVLYIEGGANLFSESTLTKKGYILRRDANGSQFQMKGGQPGPTATMKGGMYEMNFRTEQKAVTRLPLAVQPQEKISYDDRETGKQNRQFYPKSIATVEEDTENEEEDDDETQDEKETCQNPNEADTEDGTVKPDENTSASTTSKEDDMIEIRIRTPRGEIIKTVRNTGRTVIPYPDRELRDRTKIKPPKRFANIILEPRTYREALLSKSSHDEARGISSKPDLKLADST
jgi:gag-polypeptide of LTR copia-type/Zinc knuckle